MWFKEYAYNILVQPFHLIIYVVIVGTAIELATENLIYAIVAIYFLIPAEKLLRKFFGFDNAGTLSAAGSFAGGALFSTMVGMVNRPKPKDEKDDKKEKEKKRKITRDGNVSTNSAFGALADGEPTSGGGSGPAGILGGILGGDPSGGRR